MLGLLEPYSTVRILGSDALFYIRVIQEGFFATLIATVHTPSSRLLHALLSPYSLQLPASLSMNPPLSLFQVLTLPAMAFNMGLLTPPPDLAANYAPYVAAGLLSGVTPASTWTVNASWSDRSHCTLGIDRWSDQSRCNIGNLRGTCDLGVGAPLTWGRPGGNAEVRM